MKHATRLLILMGALAAPVQADEPSDGRSLIEEGMRLFLEGLQAEMSPALGELQSLLDNAGPSMRAFLHEMGPAFAELLNEVRDWTAYHPPEILPNGDIIIRRKEPEPAKPEPLAPPSGPTDI